MTQLIPQVTLQEESELLRELTPRLRELNPKLPEYLLHRLKRNPSAAMPYHGNLHTVLFLRVLLEICSDERVQITPAELSALVSAAIHHDYDYRTTAGDDLENIEASQKAWHRGAAFWPTGDEELVSRLIRATYLSEELPKEDPHYHLMTLMRDADLAGWIYPEYRDRLEEGLRQEKGYEPFKDSFLEHFTFYNEATKDLLRAAGIA